MTKQATQLLHTTFRLLREHYVCQTPYKALAKQLGGIRKHGRDTPIYLNGLSMDAADAIWALCAVPKEQRTERDRIARLFACDCAERSLPLFEKACPHDKRPREAIAVARAFALGGATPSELAAAWNAAWDAARAAQIEQLIIMLEAQA